MGTNLNEQFEDVLEEFGTEDAVVSLFALLLSGQPLFP